MSANKTTPESVVSNQLVDALARLADEIRVMRDVLSEIREDLNWAIRNEQPGGGDYGHSLLKEMARDPTSDDWGERLRIVRDSATAGPDDPDAAESSGPASANDPSATTEPGHLF